ncbi:MAG: aspartyl protease family protein [Bacteroidota bacterium]|nr:aspartyl protease family protein [Bacteroidota bacterium]
MKKIILLTLTILVGLNSRAQDVIPFSLTDSGHIVIEAKVDSIAGTFIFDTGAGLNMFFGDFPNKLGQGETNNFFVGHRATGEAMKVPIYHSNVLSIGNREFKNQIYSTFDINIGKIDGIISLQAFENLPVIIDYEKKELSFRELKDTEKKKYIDIQIADYAGKSLDIFTYIKVNNKVTIQVLLDSGAGANSFWIDESFSKSLSIDLSTFDKTERKSEFDANKIFKIYNGLISSISTENNLSKVEKPRVIFVEGLIYEGKTSIEWLGKKIAISIPDKKIYIIE